MNITNKNKKKSIWKNLSVFSSNLKKNRNKNEWNYLFIYLFFLRMLLKIIFFYKFLWFDLIKNL